MNSNTRLMLYTRALTSRLPRIRGLGILLAFVADHFRKMGLDNIEVNVLGNRMLLNPSDLLGNALIFTPQWFDVRERMFIEKTLSMGDYMVDVGANIGAYSLICANIVGPCGKVTAIEAELSNASKLKHNIKINHITWIDVVNYGVSDKNEVLTMLLNSTGNAGGHSFFEQSDTEKPPEQTAHCFPLSDLIDTQNKAKIMKIDIEGFEHRVLKKFFQDVGPEIWPEFIMFEDNPQRREDDTVALVLNHGYTIIERLALNIIVGR